MKRKYLTPKQRAKRILEFGLEAFGTKSKFARAVGTDPRNLTNLLRSPDPKISTLAKLADTCGVPVVTFIEK